MTSRLLCSTAAALVGVAVLAACGGGGDDDGDAQIASPGTTTTPATTVPPAATSNGSSPPAVDPTSSASAPPDGSEIETLSSDPEEAALDYVECMRDHGIDMPDPQPGGGILVQQGEDGDGAAGAAPVLDSEGFEAADAECRKYMEAAFGAMEIDPEQEAEMRENMLEYAQCMRDHGIDMADPQFDGEGHVDIQIGDPDGGEQMDQEEFEAANEACGQDGGGIAIGAAPAPQDGE